MQLSLIFVSAIVLTAVILSTPVFVFGGRASYDGQAPEDIIVDYCIAHADRVVAGENVVQDLVNAGLVSSYYSGKTCEEVKDLQSQAHFSRCNTFNELITGDPLDPDC